MRMINHQFYYMYTNKYSFLDKLRQPKIEHLEILFEVKHKK
jgi:hypothetical protein